MLTGDARDGGRDTAGGAAYTAIGQVYAGRLYSAYWPVVGREARQDIT